MVVVSIHGYDGLTPLGDEQLRRIVSTVYNRDEAKAAVSLWVRAQRDLDRKALSAMSLGVCRRGEGVGVRQTILAELEAGTIRYPFDVIVKLELSGIQSGQQYSASI